MNFEENLRERIKKSRFGSREREVLKFVLGELQNKQVTNKVFVTVTDENCHSMVKAVIQTNLNNLNLMAEGDARRAPILEENGILSSLLPVYLTVAQIQEHLVNAGLVERIKAASSEGAAMGQAMPYFKKSKLPVEGDLVKAIVNELRSAELPEGA